MSDELKPCPFCGKKNVIVKETDTSLGEFYYVECYYCESTSGKYISGTLAKQNWNDRVVSPELLECLEEVVKMVPLNKNVDHMPDWWKRDKEKRANAVSKANALIERVKHQVTTEKGD